MNWSALLRTALKPRTNRWRLVLWASLISLIFGYVEFGEPLEDILRDTRYATRSKSAGGEITLVAIDDRSLKEFGQFPWPRERHAELIRSLDEMGAKQIFFEIIFADPSDPKNDAALADALQGLGARAVLPVMFSFDRVTGERVETYPLPELAREAELAHVNMKYGPFGTVRRLPYVLPFEQGSYQSLASKIAGVSRDVEEFPIDFSIKPSSVPTVSAADVFKGTAPRAMIAGKRVVIGYTFHPLNEGYSAPGYGILPSVYLHILGAETLLEGNPREIPWLLSFIPALVVVVLATLLRRRLISIAIIAASALVYLVLPVFLEKNLIFIQIIPPLFLLLIVGIASGWAELRQMYKLRGTTNPVSGLPNLTALNLRKVEPCLVLVAARVHNYAAIASAVPADAEKALVEQIANRLMLGASEPLLYQGDEGIFAWLSDAADVAAIGAHLDALHTLFRSPVVIQGRPYDLKVTFGFEVEDERSVANRLASALVAADEALREGRKWKKHDPSNFQDADWKFSLLSQLESAIDAGDLWVAYQPKISLISGRIIGAEALARWTHPEKGPVSPSEFILAAEESNRIDRLTEFVLTNAIRSAASINRYGINFSISVNISGVMIGDPNILALTMDLLAKHGLSSGLLILEVTETAALDSSDRHLHTLQKLRDFGVRISVDDYGTGMSTLDYLQRIPATEIKIDRSFVQGMRVNHGTRVMVNSTIQLAHSLGHDVVAEGVEDQETLEELKRMNCDAVQGYLTGRPMTFRALSKKVLGEHRRDSA